MLRGTQAEPPEPFARRDVDDSQIGEGPDPVGLASQRAIGRHLIGSRQPHHDTIADASAQFLGDRRIEDRLVARERCPRPPCSRFQLPEVGGHTQELHVRRATCSIDSLQFDRASHQHRRRHQPFVAIAGPGGRHQFLGQFAAEEAIDHQHFIDAAKPVEHQRAETAADGIADQQRAAQHGGGGRDAQRHRGVNAAMVTQSAKEKLGSREHGGLRGFRSGGHRQSGIDAAFQRPVRRCE